MQQAGDVFAKAGRTNSSLATIDGIRGFAALWVVLFHAYIWVIEPGGVSAFSSGFAEWAKTLTPVDWVVHALFGYGFLGVNVFFVVSGFCIHYPNAKNETKSINLGAFFRRRFYRIYPLYFAVALALFVLYGPILSQWESKGVDIINILGHLFFWHYWGPQNASGMGISGVMWTLALEVQFYALYAILYPALRRIGMLRAAVFFLILEAVYRALAVTGAIDPDSYHDVLSPARFSIMRFGEWLLGACVAEWWVGYQKSENRAPAKRFALFKVVFYLSSLSCCIVAGSALSPGRQIAMRAF
jgi:peptidoglycan/LPS O-acetylase OafA/YrhL